MDPTINEAANTSDKDLDGVVTIVRLIKAACKVSTKAAARIPVSSGSRSQIQSATAGSLN